jgi:hypothetical protein
LVKNIHLPWFPFQPRYYPWQPAGSPTTPLNALVSGPLAGGNWEAGDLAPRAVSVEYWEKACPQSERVIVKSSDAKEFIRDAEGEKVFKHMVQLIRDIVAPCVEVLASDDDGFPQLFDLWLVGSPRSISMGELFLNSATSRLLGPSPVVRGAIDRNLNLFLPRGPRPSKASHDPFQRMLAVHIRRGDFGPACKDRALWASTYYQW